MSDPLLLSLNFYLVPAVFSKQVRHLMANMQTVLIYSIKVQSKNSIETVFQRVATYYLQFTKTNSPEQGLEPWTFRLKAWRSTNWATRALRNEIRKLEFKKIKFEYFLFCSRYFLKPANKVDKIPFGFQ